MNPRVRSACGLAVGMLATVAFAQNAGDYDQERPPKRATEIPTEGFWPTQKMMERIIDRITEQMSEHYQFDDNQLELTRELFKARFPEFLNANRAEIQTLMNQYFEALLDDEPPSVEGVAEWAQRVQPLMAEFNEVCHEVAEGLREYLTDEQQTLLDAEEAAFQTGVTMVQNKLSVWAGGGYDPETEWIHPGPERRQREREEQQRQREAMDEARRQVIEEGASPDAAAAAAAGAAGSEQPEAGAKAAPKPAKDEWAIYTERFIERYQLNDEQKQKAFAFLHRHQEERDKYLRRKTDEMGRVTKLLKEAETEEQRQAALEAYERLNGPIERMFEQLKDKLDTLPTRAQRRAAAEAGLLTDEEVQREHARVKPAETAPADEGPEEPQEPSDAEPPATQPTTPPP
jgi:hypothetical protein